MKSRFERMLQRLNLRKKLKHKIYLTCVDKDYMDRLIKNVQPLPSLFLCFYYCAKSSTPLPMEFPNISEQPLESFKS